MSNKITVIINEQHSLLENQKQILDNKFKDYEFLKVPADGWNKAQMNEIMNTICGTVVFVSPIPYMIKNLSEDAVLNKAHEEARIDGYGYVLCGESNVKKVFVMCNDNREKKELPNGKIISGVSKEGWYLA